MRWTPASYVMDSWMMDDIVHRIPNAPGSMPCHEHYLFTKGCACAAAAPRPCTITSLLCWVRAFFLWFLCAHQVLGEQISRTVADAGMYWQAYNTCRIWNVKVGTKKWSTHLSSFKTIRSDGLDFFFFLVLQLAMAAADWPAGLLFLNIYRHRNMFSMALPIHIHCSVGSARVWVPAR